MKKIIILYIVLCGILFPEIVIAQDEEMNMTPQQILEEQQNNLNLEGLEEFIHQVNREISPDLSNISFSRILEGFKSGELNVSPQDVIKNIFSYFLREVAANLSLLGKLIIIAVICSILQTLQAAFEKGTVAKLAYFVCYLVIITLAIGSFKLAIDIGLAAITKMVSFMELLLPVLLVLLTAMGGLTTVALLQPFLLLFLSFMSAFTQNIIFPFIFLTAVLAIANDISDNFKVSKIASLFKQLTKVGIGLVLTLFIGVITVEGVAGSVVDGVTLRTAKYVTGAFVPVAGSMFADALDAVIGGSLLLKNAIGITGVLVLAIIVIFPVLKIIAIAVIYHLAAALLQPLGNSQIAQVLDDMSSSLFLTFAAVASVAIMFFMTITIIVGAANFTVMLR
ncbi:MAG: stage III sporulation protein AE [Clostridia bacterium]|nr:stage III sporulation protein AE [Clostridia bacterium]